MKKNKKSIIIVIITILMIISLSILIILFYPDYEKKESKVKQIKNIIENVYFSDKITLNKLETVTGNDFINDIIFWGEDSALRVKPSTTKINKYKLNKYVKLQNKYAPLVEKKLKSNIKYTLKETDDGDVKLNIKPWYYDNYVNDMTSLSTKLLKLSGYDVESNLENKDFEIYEYKARIISMEILNDYLNNYNNKDEIINFEFQFDNKDNPEDNEYFSLYCNLSGITSKYSSINYEEDESTKNERLNTYIEEAITKGIITKANPLNL